MTKRINIYDLPEFDAARTSIAKPPLPFTLPTSSK